MGLKKKKAWTTRKQPERQRKEREKERGTIKGGQPPCLRHSLPTWWLSVGSDVVQQLTNQLLQPGFLSLDQALSFWASKPQCPSCQDHVCITQRGNGMNLSILSLSNVSHCFRPAIVRTIHREDYFKLLLIVMPELYSYPLTDLHIEHRCDRTGKHRSRS